MKCHGNQDHFQKMDFASTLTNQRRKRLNLIGSLVSQENIIRVLGFYKSLDSNHSTEPERDWLSEMGRKDSDVVFWPHNC